MSIGSADCSPTTIPIRGDACACSSTSTGLIARSGYLLKRSGVTELIEGVADADNNVRVRELAGNDRFRRWLEETGLTLEEAAWISPRTMATAPTYPQEKRAGSQRLGGSRPEVSRCIRSCPSRAHVSGSVPTRAATGRCWANPQLRPALSPNATLDETEELRGQAVRTRSMNSSFVPHSISASVTLSMSSEPDTASRSADSWPAVSSPNFLAMIRRRTKA